VLWLTLISRVRERRNLKTYSLSLPLSFFQCIRILEAVVEVLQYLFILSPSRAGAKLLACQGRHPALQAMAFDHFNMSRISSLNGFTVHSRAPRRRKPQISYDVITRICSMIGPKRCEVSERIVMVLFKMLKLGEDRPKKGEGRCVIGGTEDPFLLYLEGRGWRFWSN
jgi:hypothetical protein